MSPASGGARTAKDAKRSGRGAHVAGPWLYAWDVDGQKCDADDRAAVTFQVRGRYRFDLRPEAWTRVDRDFRGPAARHDANRLYRMLEDSRDAGPTPTLCTYLEVTPPAATSPDHATLAPLNIDVAIARRNEQLERQYQRRGGRKKQHADRKSAQATLREYFGDRDLRAEPPTAADDEAFVTYRSGANRRTRRQHTRNCPRCAASSGSFDPTCPDLPIEGAGPRTVEFGLQEYRAVLQGIATETGYSPDITFLTREQREQRVATYHRHSLPSPEQIWALYEAQCAIVHGTLTGERWALATLLQGFCGLRPEEAVALVVGDFHLDDPVPHVLLGGSEAERPQDPLGPHPETRRGPLKHRHKGDVRPVAIPPDVVPYVRAHIERHAAKNGRMFTSERGKWWDRSSAWQTKWWKPARDAVLGKADNVELRTMDNRMLRHAAITAWLYGGKSVGEVARMAGNTEQVVETAYRGVIDELQMRIAPLPPTRVAGSTQSLETASLEELLTRQALFTEEIARRARASGVAA